jgi:hypothetical protein
MTYLEKAQDIYNMMAQGQMMDAFEKYYAENVVMQELGEEPRVGKDVNRQFEIQFMSGIKEMHGAGVTAMASNEEQKVVFIENWLDVTFMDGNRINMVQVNVQYWEGDFVVKEIFYHK